MQQPPIVLTIAGSDSGGGAGIQADLKTFAALGCYGSTVITAVTAQNTMGIRAVHSLPSDLIRSQLEAVLEDLPPAAIKIGMLPDAGTIQIVAEILNRYPTLPVILDPVVRATSGEPLSTTASMAALQQYLFPLAMLVTPNLPEAAALTGIPVRSRADMEAAAPLLLRSGSQAVLIKGGHLEGPELMNLYVHRSGARNTYHYSRISTGNTHGTGCTLSSAIAAFSAKGFALPDAIAAAGNYVHQAIEAASNLKIGQGCGPLQHFFSFK